MVAMLPDVEVREGYERCEVKTRAGAQCRYQHESRSMHRCVLCGSLACRQHGCSVELDRRVTVHLCTRCERGVVSVAAARRTAAVVVAGHVAEVIVRGV